MGIYAEDTEKQFSWNENGMKMLVATLVRQLKSGYMSDTCLFLLHLLLLQ